MMIFKKIAKAILPSYVRWRLRLFYYRFLNFLRFGIPALFDNVEIETITECNRRCLYCPNSKFDRGKHLMKEELFKKIIMGLKELNFSGFLRPHFYGEPLLDKRLPRLVNFARKNLPYCKIELYTNGDFLTKGLFEQLLESGVDMFFVTVHEGHLPQNIKKLLKTKKGQDRIDYEVITAGTALFNRGGLVKVRKNIEFKKCNLASDYLIVDYKGNVVLCCNDYLSSNIFGNLAKEKIIDVWRKAEYKSVRRAIKNGIFLLDICKKCRSFLSP